MYKTDKRLTENHLSDEEKNLRAEYEQNLKDVAEKAETFEVEMEVTGLLEKIKAKKSTQSSTIQKATPAAEQSDEPPQQDLE